MTTRRQWLQKSLLASSSMLFAGAVPRPFVHKDIAKLGSLEEYLPLHWNENPNGPSPKAIAAVKSIAETAHRYPFDSIEELKQKIATRFTLEVGNIMLTAGSTEMLSLLGQHAGLAAGEIVSPKSSFPTLNRFGERTGAVLKQIDLAEGAAIDFEKLFAAITDKTSLVSICNPNNPTSVEANNKQLIDFCRRVPSNVLIAVDEAYIEYSNLGEAGSLVSLVPELDNLVVCRTFSKAYGLAGLRIGYGVSQKKNIEALRNRHLGFEISAGHAPIAAALAALDDQEYLKVGVRKNEEGKQIVVEAFEKWGVAHNKSSTNFIYAESKHFVSDVRGKLKEDKILITKWRGIMDEHIRISISTPDHMRQFIDAIEQYLI